MHSPRLGSAIFGIVLALAPGLVFAQTPDAVAPAHVAHAEGTVLLEREGETYDDVYGLPFVPGDVLRTIAGRAEVLFSDGTILHLDDRSSIELLAETLLRLTEGRVLLVVAGADDAANALQYQIDTPAASAFTDGPGEYELTLLSAPGGPQAELSVVRGYASLSTDHDVVELAAGQRSIARDGTSPAHAQAFNSARLDAFEAWSRARRGERVTRAASSQYLPPDLRVYGATFDRHGSWAYEEPYGYVWYPSVAATWRPYHLGYWRSYPTYGWTWIGLDPWGWPTHHYGRWGHKHSRWYWIPGRVWGAAWVHWVGAPAYVGWSPLGWNDRPVFAFAFGTPNIWTSWVVVPRSSFGVRHHYVHHHYVPGHRIPRGTAFASYESSAPIAWPHRDASVRRAPDRGLAASRTQPGRSASTSRAAGRSSVAPETRTASPGDARAGVGRSAHRRSALPQASAASTDSQSRAPARTVAPRGAIRRAPAAGTARGAADSSPVIAPPGERPSAVRRSAPGSPREATARPEARRIVPRSSDREPMQASPAPQPPSPRATPSPRSAPSRVISAEPPAAPRVRPVERPPAESGGSARTRSGARAESAPSAPDASGGRSTRSRAGASSAPPSGAGGGEARGSSGAARRRSR